jgi:hypothetical protein
MELRNAKLFIDGTETPVENVQIGYDTASGPDQTVVSMVTGLAEWNVGAFRSFLELIEDSSSVPFRSIKSAKRALAGRSWQRRMTRAAKGNP